MKIECPDGCSGGYADRQMRFPFETAGNLTEEIRGVLRKEVIQPMRCTYCGCVYGHSRQVLGHYNNGILGEGWR